VETQILCPLIYNCGPMTAADDPPFNPGSGDSDGNLVVPRHGIRIAMGLALVAAGAYWLFTFISEREMRTQNPLQPSPFPESLWVTILWVAVAKSRFLAFGSGSE